MVRTAEGKIHSEPVGDVRNVSWLSGELPAERREALIEAAAEWVVRKGLEAPAVMFLEMHRPLATLAGAGYAFIQPPLMLMFGFRRTEELRLLLSDADSISALVDRIEKKSRRRAGAGTAAPVATGTAKADDRRC